MLSTLVFVLVACFSRSPAEGVPDQAVKIAVTSSSVRVDGTTVGEFSLLEANPTGDDVSEVVEALAPFDGRPAWIEVPGATGFFVVRKLINTARRAGLDPIVVSEVGGRRAYPMRKSPTYDLGGSCPDGPVPVIGTRPLLTVWIQTGRGGTWILGEARHLPVVGTTQRPTDFFEPSCLAAPDCGTVYPSPARQALCEGDGGPQQVRLGGDAAACWVPIAATSDDVAPWPDAVARHVTRLGLDDQPLIKVVPEAQSPVAALLATLEGFRKAAAPLPAVGTRLLVEGNDGPLACAQPGNIVESADDLADAGARYLGTLTGS